MDNKNQSNDAFDLNYLILFLIRFLLVYGCLYLCLEKANIIPFTLIETLIIFFGIKTLIK